MALPPPHDFLGLSEFSSGFLEDICVDFAAKFDLGLILLPLILTMIDRDWSRPTLFLAYFLARSLRIGIDVGAAVGVGRIVIIVLRVSRPPAGI